MRGVGTNRVLSTPLLEEEDHKSDNETNKIAFSEESLLRGDSSFDGEQAEQHNATWNKLETKRKTPNQGTGHQRSALVDAIIEEV